MEEVYVPRTPQEKAQQRALLQYRRPENAPLVREALIKAGREDLIGYSAECLVRPAGGANQTRKPAQGKVQGKPAQGKPAAQGKKPVAKTGGKPTAKKASPSGSPAAPAKKKPIRKAGQSQRKRNNKIRSCFKKLRQPLLYQKLF